MTGRTPRVLAGLGLALAAVAFGGCGVQAESVPEPLPSTAPAVTPPSVTQEPAPPTTNPTPTPPAPPAPP